MECSPWFCLVLPGLALKSASRTQNSLFSVLFSDLSRASEAHAFAFVDIFFIFTYCKSWAVVSSNKPHLHFLGFLPWVKPLTIWGLNDWYSPKTNDSRAAARESLQLQLSRFKTVIQCNAIGCIASQEYLRLHLRCPFCVSFLWERLIVKVDFTDDFPNIETYEATTSWRKCLSYFKARPFISLASAHCDLLFRCYWL